MDTAFGRKGNPFHRRDGAVSLPFLKVVVTACWPSTIESILL
jgi:hypothetical protein